MTSNTSTIDGYTYIIKTVEPNPDYPALMQEYNLSDNKRSFLNKDGMPRPQMYIDVEIPYTVPNGKWVYEHRCTSYSQLIGATSDEVDRVSLGRHDWTLYISDKPFGFVLWESDADGHYVRAAKSQSLNFESARQVHKGELSQFISVPELDFVAEKLRSPQEGATNGDRRRARMGWVRLVDLIDATDYAPEQLLETFATFGCQSFRSGPNRGDMVMDVVLAGTAAEIKGTSPEVTQFTTFELIDLIRKEKLGSVWVRRGFANTVLRLVALKFTLQPSTAYLKR